ncbi:MAG: FHA domain-containing protein [Acidimicrobiaceae bacterium]|nr:FHA domain-containing protein [Acidimicrobiaceae bacterium]
MTLQNANEGVGLPATHFRVGHGLGLVTDSTLALLEPTNGRLADQLWASLAAGGSVDDLLELLSATGLRSLGSFALVQFEDAAVRVVVRGDAAVVLDGSRSIRSGGVRTWIEEVVDHPGEIALQLVETEAVGLPFRVVQGMVPADLLVRGPVSGALDAADMSFVATFDPAAVVTPAADVAPPVDAPPVDLAADVPSPVAPPVPEPAVVVAPTAVVDPAPAPPPSVDDPMRTRTLDELHGPPATADGSVAADDSAPVSPAAGKYDDIYGRTIARSVQSAAVDVPDVEVVEAAPPVSVVPPQPTAEPSVPSAPLLIDAIPSAPSAERPGDHDGRTMTKAQLMALRAGGAGTPAAELSPGSMGGPSVQALLCVSQHPNPPQARVCRVCGVPLQGSPVLISRPTLARLRFSDGRVVALDRPVLIGRNPKVEHPIDGEMPGTVKLDVGQGLSRTHALVRLEGWQVLLEDLNSANGTIVRLPQREPRRLHPGEPVLLEPGTTIDFGGEIDAAVEQA